MTLLILKKSWEVNVAKTLYNALLMNVGNEPPITEPAPSTIVYLRNRSTEQNIVSLTADDRKFFIREQNVFHRGYRSEKDAYFDVNENQWYSGASSSSPNTDRYIMSFAMSVTGLQSKIRPAIPSLSIFTEIVNEFLIRTPTLSAFPAYNELFMRVNNENSWSVAFVGDPLQWKLDKQMSTVPVPYFLRLDPAAVQYIKTHYPVNQTGFQQIAFDDGVGNRISANHDVGFWTQIFIETSNGEWWLVGVEEGDVDDSVSTEQRIWLKIDGLRTNDIYEGTCNTIALTVNPPTYNPCAGAVSEVAISVAGTLGTGGLTSNITGYTGGSYNNIQDLLNAGPDAFGPDIETIVLAKSTETPDANPDVNLDNGYVYDGYRYVQFGVNIQSNTLLKLETTIPLANVEIKPLSRTGWLDPVSDLTELAELVAYDTNSPIWQQQTTNKRTIYGFKTDEPGVGVFQIKMPVDASGTLYFGTMPTDDLSNILIHNPIYNRIETSYNNVPAPTVSRPSVTVPQATDIGSAEGYYSVLMYGSNDYLMPGTAIAFSKLNHYGKGNFGFVHPDVRLVDPKWVGFSLDGNDQLRNSINIDYNCGSVWFGGNHFYANDATQALYRHVDFSTYPGLSSFQSRTGVIHRTADNKLVLITYEMLNDEVAVNVEEQLVLVENLADIGFPPSLGMKFVINTINNGNSIFEITKPYPITLDELLDFEPDITYEIDTDILVTDIYGTNVLMKP